MTYVLFDLDGTLSDSREGIINSFQYSLKNTGYQVEEGSTLLQFIGPPIMETFREFYEMDEETALKAHNFFQERYRTKGKFENTMYDGIPELLNRLVDKKYTLGVATSKPEIFANDILLHFGISHYFSTVVGASLDDNFSKKEDILALAIKKLGATEADNIYMVGDRSYDMLAAKKHGANAIGVTYGFGSEDELKTMGAMHLCHTPEEVGAVIL